MKVMSEERADYIGETLADEQIEDTPNVEYRDPIKELGFAKVDHIVTLDASLSDGAYRTYALLHFYWQQKKLAWMGVATIAKARGVSGPTLKRHLKELQDAGLISRSRRMGQSSITYLENLPKRYEDAAKTVLTARSKMSRKSYQKRYVGGITNDTREEEQVEEEQKNNSAKAENPPSQEKPADPPTVKAAKARIQVAAVEGAASAGKRRGVADPRKAAKDEREQMQGDVVRVWTQGGQVALPDVTSIAHKIAFDHYAAIESGTITREQWRGAIENLMNGGGNKYRDGTAKDVWMVGKDIDDFVRTGPRQSWDSIPRFRAED